jgi:hypothetical protein
VWSGSTRVRCGALVETACPAQSSDASLLAGRLRADGYLFCRGLLQREMVLKARAAVFSALGIEDGAVVRELPSLLSRQDVAALPAVARVLENPAIAALIRRACSGLQAVGHANAAAVGAGAVPPYQPLPYKWLRAVPPGLFTGVHCDQVYFPGADERCYTAWIPIGDVPVEHGAMMVCEGAFRGGHARYDALRQRYLVRGGASGTRQRGNGADHGWYARDASQVVRECGQGCRWLTADIHAGDVVVLPMETLHCTAVNTTQRHRISADVRWLPISDNSTRPSSSSTEPKAKRVKGPVL